MRWKYFIPAVILFGGIIAFNVLFLDSLLKRTLIAGGQAAFGAKVEVKALKTRFSNLSVRIQGLKVADKNDVWRDLFEVEDIRFGIKPWPLLSKKFIIEDMALEGVRWGTKRATSGALPPRKAAAIAKNNQKEDQGSLSAKLMAKIEEEGKSEVNKLPSIQSIKSAQSSIKDISVEKMVNIADLKSLAGIETERKNLEAKYSGYQSRLAGLKIDEKIKAAVAAVNEASKIKVDSVADIGPAQQKLNALKSAQDDLNKALSDVDGMRSEISKDLGEGNSIIARLNDLKDKDYQNIASKLQLPSFSLGNVSKYIFGSVWIDRVNNVVYYLHLARKYMPNKAKKQEIVISKRAKGIDVRFPKESEPPDFLIEKITLSGTTGGPGKEGSILDFKGTVSDVTSDPALLGRPTRITITGSKQGRMLDLTGVLDHTGAVATDRLVISFFGLTPQDIQIPSSDYFPSFDRGSAAARAEFVLKGDKLDCTVALTLSGLTLPQNKAMNADVQSVLAMLWQGINSIGINAHIAGGGEGLEMSVTSNIDKLLSDRLKNVYGAALAQVQDKVKNEINRLTQEKQKELMAEITKQRDSLLKEYLGKENEVRSSINGVKSQENDAQSRISSQADSERKKAEDELKKKAAEQLQNLFK